MVKCGLVWFVVIRLSLANVINGKCLIPPTKVGLLMETSSLFKLY